jgi:hypothetical protein
VALPLSVTAESAAVVLRVNVTRKAVGVSLPFEGVGLDPAHGATNGDEEGGVAGWSEDLRVEVGMLPGDDADFLLCLILMVVSVGDDSPLVAAIG